MHDIRHPRKEVTHESLKDLISQEGKEDARNADADEDDLADEDSRAFSRFMHRVDVISSRVVIFQTIPAKLVSTRTRHMRTARGLLDRDLTLGALVGQEEEVDEPY